MTDALSVGELLRGVDNALAAAYPGPVWVRGELSGLRRTNRGAVFFNLIDPADTSKTVNVGARALVMMDIERSLDAAKVGSLRDGVEIKVEGTVAQRGGRIQISLLRVDTEFIAGKLALDRQAILDRLHKERVTEKNRALAIPLVPLSVGLVTSVGSAAHADFLSQLTNSGHAFAVKTATATMQGETSSDSVIAALDRLGSENIDVVAIVRGGGAKLDMASFDSEQLARAIAASPFPIITGIGHQTDRTIADEVAAIPVKTPSAAGEWLVDRVRDFSDRVERARLAVRDQARLARKRVAERLDGTARELGSARSILARQREVLDHLETGVAGMSRVVVGRQRERINSLAQLFSSVGLEPTLQRGFALVTRADGGPVARAADLVVGAEVDVRFFDGKVTMRVEEKNE